MLSSRSQLALTPAVRAAGRTFSTAGVRSSRQSSGRRASLATVLQAKPALRGQALVQHRAKSSSHRPGCSWASSTSAGHAKSVPRDRDCPACQHDVVDPFDATAEGLMMQHKRQMVEFRRFFERDPYDALFGMSNRRLNALWNSHFAFPDVKSMLQSRASLHSTSKSSASASETRRVPANNDEGDFRASVTWSHSGVDAKGKTFDKSGKLVYDPVTGKMVQSKEEVDHVSTTAAPATVVGQVVHQTIVEEGKSPEIKYARPSTDPEEIPEDSVSKAQQKMMRDIQEREAKLEAAKDRANSAVGVEKDAREYNFHDPTAKDDIIASGAPPRNINNEMGRLVNLEFDDLKTADKYVTPTADAPTEPVPEEKVRGSMKATIEQVMQREKELEAAKEKADSAVGVEEDATRAGWTADSNPSRTVSSSQDLEPPTRSGHSTNPISNASFLDSANSQPNVPKGPSAFGGEEKMSTSSISSMDRIKAKERDIEAAKRSLNTFKVKQHEMESSWQREQGPRSTYSGDVRSTQSWPTPQQLDRQARLREEKQTKAKAWASFKNATPSKRYPDYQHELGAPDSSTGVPDSVPVSAPAAEETSTGRPARVTSEWKPVAPSEQPSGGLKNNRDPSTLSVFTKEKPLKSMSHKELDRERAAVMKTWPRSRMLEHVQQKPTAAEAMLDKEVSAQKNAMTWFENKWRWWRQHPEASTTPERTRSKTSPVETVAAEGDMAPNVADFATTERWYKNKAPHATTAEEPRPLQDAELVQSLKGIYEQTYGSIDKAQPSSQSSQSQPTEIAKKPSVHATLENSCAPDEIDHALRPPTKNQSLNDFELRAYSTKTGTDAEIAPMTSDQINLRRLNQYMDKTPMQLAQALTQLRASSQFADYLIKNDKLGEQIVYAKGDLLVTRIPKSTKVQGEPRATSSSPSRASINPIDGTAAMPNLTPQTGNFASPTGFVNHDIISPVSKRSSQSVGAKPGSRKVRKEEPVFSGAIPHQKYSVSEIVTLLKDQGVGGSKTGGDGGRAGASYGYEKAQRRKDWKFVRFFRKGLLITMLSGFTLANFYAIGVVIEYFRDGPTFAGDSPTSSWDDRSYTRASTIGLWGSSSREAERREKEKKEQAAARGGHFEDMPLHGAEYPLLGILAACVWYLLSSGQ